MAGGQNGRPTKYSAEMLKKAQFYIKNYADYGDAIPNVAGLAIELGVAKSTVYLWATNEKNAAFSDALEMVATNQERKLLTGGLTGSMNPTITKVILTNHGYSDKPKDEANPDIQPMTFNFTVNPAAGDVTVTNANTE